jgi:signal transduction histidine kinase
MPLRLRLTVVFALIAAVLVAAGSLFVHSQLDRNLRDSLDDELEIRSATLADALESSPTGDVGADVERHLASPRAFGQVLDPDGRVAASATVVADRTLLSAEQLAEARRGSLFATVDLPDLSVEEARLLAEPVARDDGDWVVIVGSSLEPADEAAERVVRFLVISGIAGVALATLGAWLLAGAALAPVERMRRQVADISDRQPGERIAVPATRDEIAALARTMNQLLDRLTGALARERRLVSDTAHELRSPLAVLRTELELAQRPGRSRDDLQQAITNAADETDRLAHLAEDLLLLTRSDEGAALVELRRQPLAPVLTAASRAARDRARGQDIQLDNDIPDDLAADIDEHRLRQAVDNLLDNAIQAAPAGTTVSLSATATDDTITVSVTDHGPGFPPEFIPHALERFSRADPARARDHGGAGLGLAIVDTISRAHNGHTHLTNQPGGGANVSIALPRPTPDTSGRKPSPK